MPKASPKKSAVKKTVEQNNKKTPKNFDADFPNNAGFPTDADASLQDLFLSELKDTYWAEKHLVKSLPKMVAAAASTGLRQALSEHLEVTVNQVARLEEVFELLGEKIAAKKCDAMEGLTISGEHVIENTVTGTETRDTGIIMSGLKVENFEITTYKGLIQVANTLGKADIAELLQQSLEEEIEASDLLTELSQQGTNENAA